MKKIEILKDGTAKVKEVKMTKTQKSEYAEKVLQCLFNMSERWQWKTCYNNDNPTYQGIYTKELCRLIAKETAAEVCDYLKGTPRETLYSLKKQGRKPSPKKLGFYLSQPIPSGKRVIIIDNVVATGTTAAAAVRAIGGGIVFAYAAATNSQTRPDLIRLYPNI